jgi:ribonuclease/clavin/mitogillin
MLCRTDFENVHYWQVARSYLGKSLYTTGFFLIDDLLIDCGPPNARRILAPLFESLKVNRLVLTHHHEDHTGNVTHFLERGVPAQGHTLLSPSLDAVVRSIPAYRQMVWGRPKPAAQIADVGGAVESGKHEFLVIETPGHSPDHICLFERRNGWLFTGDLFYPRICGTCAMMKTSTPS